MALPFVTDDVIGGMEISPDSDLGRELAKWEQHPTRLVPRGKQPGNSYVFRPYPKMLFKARQGRDGRAVVSQVEPHLSEFPHVDAYNRAVLANDEQNKRSQRVVQSAEEEAIALGQGWHPTPDAALAAYERERDQQAVAAAEAAFAVRRMSAPAQAEFAAAEAATSAQVCDVPAPKRKPRGRAAWKAKQTAAKPQPAVVPQE